MIDPSPASIRGEAVAGGAVALLAALLIFAQLLAFGADMGVPAAWAALAEMALAALALAWLGPDEPAPFWLALAAPLGLLGMAGVWAAIGARLGAPLAPDAAALEQIKLLGVIGLIAVGALIGRRRQRLEALGVSLAGLGLAYALLSLWLARVDPMHVWGYPKGAHAYRFTATLLNANAAGCALAMIGLVSLGALLSRLRRFHLRGTPAAGFAWVLATGGGALAALAGSALTASRTSLVGAAVLAGASILGTLARGSRWRIVVALAALAAVVGATGLALTQIGWRWDTLAVDGGQRAAAFSHYLALAQQRSLFGAGLGGFRTLNQSTLTPADAPYLWDYGAAHCALLQAWLEAGWPDALLIALAAACLAAPVILAAVRGALGRLIAGAAAAALLAAFASTDDIAMNMPPICALAALLAGCAFGACLTEASGARAGRIAARTQGEGARA
jgi:hypothetical protein